MPTRLLDVQALEPSKDIKLVILDGIEARGNYIALSHCWGPACKSPLTTTTKNLVRHLERISFFDLSLTFKDAVKLTRDLKQRYLWIDSLCIIQDSHEDWLREAGSMAGVYGNAIFTICALSSKDSTCGCRVVNLQAFTHHHRFFDFDAGPYRIRLFERAIHKWHEEYGDDTYRHGEHGENPLRRRAWTLQERELSRRSIHFAQNMVLWQCKTLKASAELPWHEVKPIDAFQPFPIRNSVDETFSPDGPVLARDRWYELMEDYMSRLLTRDTDKLPALSGLAQSFHACLPSSQYLAGLWTGHLPQALLWRMGSRYARSRAQRSLRYRAPTWSFLSLDGEMTYESQRLQNGGGSRLEETPDDCGPTDLIIRSIDLVLSGADQYGSINKASLLLCGKMVALLIRPQPSDAGKNLGTSGQAWTCLETLDGSTAGAMYPDLLEGLSDSTQLWCLSVRPEPFHGDVDVPYELYQRRFCTRQDIGPEDNMTMGLILQQESNVTGTFRRVGLARWVRKSLFSKIEPFDFTLI